MSSQGVLLREFRCNCGRLLFRGLLFVSFVEIKCKKCGNVSVFKAMDISTDEHTGYGLSVERNVGTAS